MLKDNKDKLVIYLLVLIVLTQTTSAFNANLFWYLYAFSLLICMAAAIINSQFYDEQPTWQYLIFGIGYGTLIYGIVRAGYELITLLHPASNHSITNFLIEYGPLNIWHYTILIFIIVVGEEMFWRGFVQQRLKLHFSLLNAILISSLLFSISLLIIGFVLGAISAFLAGIIFGLLYEWKRSLPLIIVAHAVFVILLFLVLPLPL